MHPFAHPGSASTRLPSVAGALLAAVVLLLTVAQAATAAGPAPFAGGLHISTGPIVDPAGRTWVADHNAGFCRVSDPAPPELGTIEHPQTPGAEGPRTCLGGLLPEAAIGPDAAGAPALVDPTPDTRATATRGSRSSRRGLAEQLGVARALQPGHRLFRDADEIHMDADRSSRTVAPDRRQRRRERQTPTSSSSAPARSR